MNANIDLEKNVLQGRIKGENSKETEFQRELVRMRKGNNLDKVLSLRMERKEEAGNRIRRMAEKRAVTQKPCEHKFELGDLVLIKNVRISDAQRKI